MKKRTIISGMLFSVLISNAVTAQEHQHNHGHQLNQSTVSTLASMYEDPKRDNIEKPEKVLDYMGDLTGKKILDLGAGTGYYTIRLAQRGADVIAADVEDGFQNYIKDRIKKSKINNVALRKVEYDDPKLTAGEVDIVFFANVYHHINERVKYISKAKRGLTKNGMIVILDYFDISMPKDIIAPPANMRVSIDKVIAELKEAGFTAFYVNVDLLKYQYIIKAQ